MATEGDKMTAWAQGLLDSTAAPPDDIANALGGLATAAGTNRLTLSQMVAQATAAFDQARLQAAAAPQNMEVQAEPHVDVVNLGLNFKQLRLDFRVQSLLNQVKPFDGEGSSKFKKWVRDMKAARIALENDDERTRMLALATLKGRAAEHCARQLTATPHITWDSLLKSLEERFIDQTDKQYALQSLRKLKQKEGELVQVFAERLEEAAEEAYGITQISNPFVQEQLRDIFADGLRDSRTIRRIIAANPSDLNGAVTLATKEQGIAKTFALRKSGFRTKSGLDEEEEMDVDALTLGEKDQVAELEKRIKSLELELGKKGLENTAKGKECYYCKKKGHFKRDCRKLKYDLSRKSDAAKN